MILEILVIHILVLVVIYLKHQRRFQLAQKIPGPWFIPCVGNVQLASLTAETLFLKLNDYSKEYKDCFRMWLGTSLWVFIHNPKDIQELLNNRELLRVDEFYHLHPLIGDGLLLLSGNRWSLHRKALSHAFSTNILRQFFPAISRHADVLVSKLNTTDNVEITDYLLLCILDAICETSMGAHINAQMDSKSAYVEAFHNASHILFKRMSNPLLQSHYVFRLTPDYKKVKMAIATLHALTDNIISAKRKQLNGHIKEDENPEGTRKPALLDVLMQCEINGKHLTDQEIKDHVNTFLFAGIDTTKSGTSFILYNIAKYKNVQERLYEEITSLIGTDPGQEINASYLPNLPYLDAVMKESLRLHTAVPVSARQTAKEITIGNYTYPEGTALWINIYGMCHDSRIFKNPYEFNPDRFLTPDWAEEYGDYAFIPFSAGLRVCIGKQYAIFTMKTIIIKILLSYQIELTYPEEQLQLLAEMVLKSKTGINLKFRKRESNK